MTRFTTHTPFRVTMCRRCSTRGAEHLAHEPGGCIAHLLEPGRPPCPCLHDQPDDPPLEQDGILLQPTGCPG